MVLHMVLFDVGPLTLTGHVCSTDDQLSYSEHMHLAHAYRPLEQGWGKVRGRRNAMSR